MGQRVAKPQNKTIVELGIRVNTGSHYQRESGRRPHVLLIQNGEQGEELAFHKFHLSLELWGWKMFSFLWEICFQKWKPCLFAQRFVTSIAQHQKREAFPVKRCEWFIQWHCITRQYCSRTPILCSRYCDFAFRDWASKMFKMSVGPQWRPGRREETDGHEGREGRRERGHGASHTDAYTSVC